jgi:hypothetical protein
MIEENIRRKIQDLINRSVPITSGGRGIAVDSQHLSACQAWLVQALNVVELAIPMPGNAYRRRVEKIAEQGGGLVQSVGSIAEIFRALLPDIDAGLLGHLGNKIRAETFDNFLDHAEHYRKEGRKEEAGVIAGVVFEDTIRRIFRDKIGDDKGQNLEDLINTLAKQEVITGQQSKQAKVASHVRTKATHALWDEFDLEGVKATIEITRLFLREHLGG